MVAALADPLKVMIAGAPASGKGTQCELIKAKVSTVLSWAMFTVLMGTNHGRVIQ